MLSDFTGAEKVYIACGYTDIRKGIDGLAAMVQQEFELDPYNGPINLDHGIEKMREHGIMRLNTIIQVFADMSKLGFIQGPNSLVQNPTAEVS